MDTGSVTPPDAHSVRSPFGGACAKTTVDDFGSDNHEANAPLGTFHSMWRVMFPKSAMCNEQQDSASKEGAAAVNLPSKRPGRKRRAGYGPYGNIN
jgi:hypothetical protein